MRFIPLDWQLNDEVPNAESMLRESGLPNIISASPPNGAMIGPDPVYRQLDEAMPHWQAYDTTHGWQLLDMDYIYHPSVGTLVPVAMAWLGQEQLLLYSLKLICIAQPDGSFTVGRLV